MEGKVAGFVEIVPAGHMCKGEGGIVVGGEGWVRKESIALG